ncbi:MAG: IMP cyclohydrolase [Clostridia bacterium]|nr:IMP cyclohydrolase [Clostridia bacterium]
MDVSRIDLFQYLRQNPYPGRGIVLGLAQGGRHAAIAYFIMGRSQNSRNRVFVEKGGGIAAEAFDPAKMADPSLVLYAPVRVCAGGVTVVTNGDQTDTIAASLARGESFEEALRTRTFEPDAPHYTSRISGMLTAQNGRAGYKLAILKACEGDPESPQRFFFEYPAPRAGEGHFLHTYAANADPLPSYAGEPKRVAVAGDADAFAAALWESLDMQNKVSLFVRYIDLHTGEAQTRILNKNR